MPDERGRAQLEQRHALPRHELDPLGQQLGGPRRDPHLDALAVGVRDDLEQLAVVEVGVGHDQLVHARGLEDRGQVLHVTENRQIDPLGRRGDRADELVVDPAAGGAERTVQVRQVRARAGEQRVAAHADEPRSISPVTKS